MNELRTAGRQMSSSENEDTAARWLVKREGGSWTDEDESNFNAWLSGSTAHRIAYLRVRKTWVDAEKLKSLSAGTSSDDLPDRGSWIYPPSEKPSASNAENPVHGLALPSKRKRWSNGRLSGALAATFVVCAIGLYAYSIGLFASRRYSTPIGETNIIALHDGSQVTLNTDSTIHVQFAPGERHVALDQGEVFFVVARDADRPFVVQAGGSRITAVGTQFSVRRRATLIQVIVTEGTVRIDPNASSSSSGHSASTVLVAAGSAAQASDGKALVRAQASGEAERLLSWRNGYVSFEDTTLADAVAEFNRSTTRQIVIGDPSIADMRLSGNFRTNNVDAFLSLLQNGFNISVQQNPTAVTLRAK
jgi:transmembrane sensor